MAKGLKREYRKQRQLMHEEYLKNELADDRFSGEEKKVLFDLLSSLKYGVNRIKEILSSLWEISKREGINVKAVIEELEIDNIIRDTISGTKAKAEYIRDIIRQKRFPRITEFEKEWKRKINKLKLPKGLGIEPPRNFEGDSLNIKFQVRTMGEYKKYIEKMKGIEEEIEGLLKLL